MLALSAFFLDINRSLSLRMIQEKSPTALTHGGRTNSSRTTRLPTLDFDTSERRTDFSCCFHLAFGCDSPVEIASLGTDSHCDGAELRRRSSSETTPTYVCMYGGVLCTYTFPFFFVERVLLQQKSGTLNGCAAPVYLFEATK